MLLGDCECLEEGGLGGFIVGFFLLLFFNVLLNIFGLLRIFLCFCFLCLNFLDWDIDRVCFSFCFLCFVFVRFEFFFRDLDFFSFF